jgi:hypothetical protein
MTDEEQEKLTRLRLVRLVKDLRGIVEDEDESDSYIATRCQFAADEIERLAAELKEYRLYEENNSIDFERYPALDPTRKNRIKSRGL